MTDTGASQMDMHKVTMIQRIYKLCFLAYLAVLPMSNTIALRNLLLLVLLSILVIVAIRKKNYSEIRLSETLHQIPLVVVLWVAFLFLFPLWAVQPDVAWKNLGGQWIESVLAWIVGFGAVWLLGRHGPSLWSLAFASMFSLVVELLLAMAAWGGILGSDFFVNPTIGSIWLEFRRLFSSTATLSWHWQNFPVGFHGIEPMHGNLGYTACQAIALLGACFFSAWRKDEKGRALGAIAAIGVCFISILIASSRGAVFFGVGVLGLAVLSYLYKAGTPTASSTVKPANRWRLAIGVAAASVTCLVLLVAYQVIAHDQRWRSMTDKVRIGLSVAKPMDLLCDGLTSETEAKIRENFKDRSPAYVDDLIGGLKGQDGGRILLMRAGLDLVLENPRGLDGSRQSYQKLIAEKCGHEPSLNFAHAHQSWIDLALALGWAGMLLFAWLLFYFLRQGWSRGVNPATMPWAMALFLISAFWLLRGFADSLYREHYLQMQALLLAYLFLRMRLAPESSLDTAKL